MGGCWGRPAPGEGSSDGGLVPRSAPFPRCHPGAPSSVDRAGSSPGSHKDSAVSLGPAPNPPSFGGCLAESQSSRCKKTHPGGWDVPGPARAASRDPGAIAGQHGPSSWHLSSYCVPGSAPPRPPTLCSPCGMSCGTPVTGGRAEAQRGKAMCAGHTAAGAGVALCPAPPISESEPGPAHAQPPRPRDPRNPSALGSQR